MDGISAPSKTCWPRGGFPESLLAASDAESLDWRRDLIRSYLEREVPMFAPRLPAETIGRLWIMLAHQQGALLNQARLAVSLGASVPYPGPYPVIEVRRFHPTCAAMVLGQVLCFAMARAIPFAMS